MSISFDDISFAIRKLKHSSKADVDGISTLLLKGCHALVEPLEILFNTSLRSGEFIDAWKVATVTPIYKCGNKSDVCNYRPISKLSNISKLFECIVKDKIYFSVKSLICSNQHGFVTGRSTVSNLAVFSEYCISAFSSGCQVDCIYTDFSKAFDKVSHKILIHKLACLGFHSIFLQWLKSYLSNRWCVVSIDGVPSEPFRAKSGVPQGSILGPLLFVLFVNDISSCFSYAQFLLYADDLKIYSLINSADDMLNLQAEIDSLYTWCDRSHLCLNIKKCFHATYSKSRFIYESSYSIASHVLQTVDQIKDLGVIFDTKFTFINHINFIISKSYAMLGFIRRNSSEFSDPYTLKLLYTSFIRSHLEYATIIWWPYHQFSIKRIEKIQKVFLKYALRSLRFNEPLPPYNARLLLLNLKPLESRRSVLSLTFVYGIIKGDLDCAALLEKINFNVPRRELRNSYPFYGSNNKTNYARNAPIARALNEFNRISSLIELDFSLPNVVFINLLKSCI